MMQSLLPYLLLATTCLADTLNDPVLPSIPVRDAPKLTGQHFRITVGVEPGFVDVTENGQYSGYLIEILEELALRAEFTYELRTPSGFGSLCSPRLPLPLPRVENGTFQASIPLLQHPEAYHERYQQNYDCGAADVNDRPLSEYSTDFYWGMYYISPERLKVNRFTIPFDPPSRSTLGMMGTATHVHSIPTLALSNPNNYQVCAFEGTAYIQTLRDTFPRLNTHGISFSTDLHKVFSNGTCDILIDAYPFLKKYTKRLSDKGRCTANGKPIGVIGEPLDYGLNYFAFGVSEDLPEHVIKTLNYWLQALMACFPQDPNGYCYEGQGSISEMYSDNGGTGTECGYVQFPGEGQGGTKLPAWAIAVITVVPVLLVLVVGAVYHNRLIQKQEKRMKKRFIQQLARNIDIGPSAHQISPEKLAEAFQHIGGQGNGRITKPDLARWMNDLNLDFLSEKDFDRLWDTMDMDGTGDVDPIEFCAFLSECEKQFAEVHQEYSALPKSEKVKLASRRLSNIGSVGLEEVERMERRNNRRQRTNAASNPQGSNATVGTMLSEAELMGSSKWGSIFFRKSSK